MGMSASQARFLSLTARKTNVEYEGQQINQQRTTLSNESSNYYSQLTSMTVPTPPSSSDFTKISYTFADGNEQNTVTSLIAKKDGTYMLNYVQEIPCDTMVVQGTNVLSGIPATNPTNWYMGSDELKDSMTTSTLPASESAITDAHRTRLIEAGIPTLVVNNMSNGEIYNKLLLESKYRSLAEEKYGEKNWMVRYELNSGTGVYEPVFYNKTELQHTDYNEKTTMSLSGIRSYVYGESTETHEMKNVSARVEQDSSGRYIALIIYSNETDALNNKNGIYYKLTTTTESDDAAYNDAMNQYYYDKAVYDQNIEEINSKIEIIQIQDKNLELKLKQLDTEENAIQTEMDAVKKVISKNVESSFKTFNA